MKANYKVVMNGKRSLNGERHSETHTGDADLEEDADLLTMAEELALELREQTDMAPELIDSLQITIGRKT